MKRPVVMLLSGALVVTAAVVPLATPTSALPTDACAGMGTANTGAGLVYPGFGASVLTTFNFSLSAGACVAKTSITATGQVEGFCGHSTGTGVTNNGRTFTWLGVGPLLAIGGELVGTLHVTPDSTTGQSCVSGASQFVVSGAVVLDPGPTPAPCGTDVPCVGNCDPNFSSSVAASGKANEGVRKYCGNTKVLECLIEAGKPACAVVNTTKKVTGAQRCERVGKPTAWLCGNASL